MAPNYKRIDNGIVRRGKSFYFTVSMGYDENKHQIRKTSTFHPPDKATMRQAEQLAKEAYFQFKQRCKGYRNYNENMKFSRLVELYLELYAPNRLKPVTAYCYENHIRYHFLNEFGNRRLFEFTPALLTDYFNHHTTITNGKKVSLSPANAKRLYGILQSIFSFAVSQNYISTSPCRNVILPAPSNYAGPPKSFTREELQEFLTYFNEYSPVNIIIKLLLFSGMRTGECLGLMWSDIDFEKNTIHIRRSLSKVGGKLSLSTPKTKNSNRTIFLSSTIRQLLREHQKHQLALFKNSGSQFPHLEMVFTSSTGNYKSRDSLYRSFKQRLKNTPYASMTLHSLRHCNATLLLNQGIDIKIVSEHLGHASIQVTGNIYADVLSETKVKTAELIDHELFLPQKSSQTKDDNKTNNK